MGKYLNVDLKEKELPVRKADSLIFSGADMIGEPDKFDQYPGEAIICVVENPWFDAAAYAFNQSELDVFKRPDGRRRTWLKADKIIVERLAS
jgi:hypothetical protein